MYLKYIRHFQQILKIKNPKYIQTHTGKMSKTSHR